MRSVTFYLANNVLATKFTLYKTVILNPIQSATCEFYQMYENGCFYIQINFNPIIFVVMFLVAV